MPNEINDSNQDVIISTFINIAETLFEMEKYDEALNYLKKALSKSMTYYGEESPRTALIHRGLGDCYLAMGNKERTFLKHYYRALAIDLICYGENDATQIIDMKRIADAIYSKGKYADAIKLYEEVLLVQEKILGCNHPRIADTYCVIAKIYYDLGNYSSSNDYYTKAVDIFYLKLGDWMYNSRKISNELSKFNKCLDKCLMEDKCLDKSLMEELLGIDPLGDDTYQSGTA